jgi:hypothetical protein
MPVGIPGLLMQPIHVDGACSRWRMSAQRACRMRPATRRRIEGGPDVKSDARDDRLQTQGDIERIG